jgi:hypothetical protein
MHLIRCDFPLPTKQFGNNITNTRKELAWRTLDKGDVGIRQQHLAAIRGQFQHKHDITHETLAHFAVMN